VDELHEHHDEAPSRGHVRRRGWGWPCARCWPHGWGWPAPGTVGAGADDHGARVAGARRLRRRCLGVRLDGAAPGDLARPAWQSLRIRPAGGDRARRLVDRGVCPGRGGRGAGHCRARGPGVALGGPLPAPAACW